MQDFFEFITDFKSQLTEDDECDSVFLRKHIEEQIADFQIRQAINVLLLFKISTDKKKELAQKIPLVGELSHSLLQMVESLVKNNDPGTAEKISSILLEAVREQIPEQSDKTGYFFNNQLELEYFRQKFSPMTPEWTGVLSPVNQIYQSAAYVLVELERYEEAHQVLFEAFSRNPLNSAAGFELAEIYKHEGRNEAFFEVTKSCYELLYRPIDIARYFRNLGYYFIEIQNWDMAIGAYYESIYWDDSVIAHHQLLYITQRMEKEAEPPEIRDTFLVALTELCIPIPPNFLWENVALTLITNPSNSIESQSLLYVLSLISKWSGSTCELEKSKVFERAFEIVLQGGKHNPESEEISLDLLIAKAEEGDSYAACGLAIFYKSGLNIDRNEESYRDWISNAANLGNPFAMFVLGKQLLGSASEFVELELATDWLKKAALAGVDVAQHYLGSCYQFEIGVKEDLEQAIEWRKKAAEQGLPIALRYLAHGFKEGGILNKDIDRAIFFYIRAAVHGDIDSQFLLAGFYKRGEYVDQSNEKYLYWTKKAADQGDVASQYLLGKHFSNEDSRDFNVAKAFQCYLNIANHGIRQKSEEPVDRYYPSACRFQEEEFRKVNDPIITGAQSLVALSYRVGNGIEKDLQEAVFWFKKAAERGDPDAQFDLGIAYKDGQEVEKDDDLAFSWFQKAAHQGHQRAQYELSRLYAGESNPNYDKPLAIEWCKKSADQGYELAQHTLGICYLTGNGVDRDHQKANHWISLAADQRVQESKDALSSFTNMPEDFELKLQKLADLKKSKEALDEKLEVLETKRRFIQSLDTYFNEKSPNYDPELGLRACIEAAEDGDSEAQHLLGRYYYEGAIVEKNFEKALSFFHLAAEQRNPESQYQLFYMYYHGEGTEVDSYEAYKWVKEAAENGHTEAQYTLGSNYKTGDYLEEDLDLSVYWFQKAADQEHIQSITQLGYAYYGGHGVKEDIHSSLSFLEKAAEQGEAEARHFLGLFYQVGKNEIERDFELSFRWFSQAAEQGYSDSQYYLGRCYLFGEGVHKDHKQAKSWLEKSGDQNHPSALYLLASTDFQYEGVINSPAKQWGWWIGAAQNGHVVSQVVLGQYYFEESDEERDNKIGVGWFRKAAKSGNAKAQYLLGQAYSTGKGVKQDLKKAEDWYQKAKDQGYTSN